MLKAMFYKDNNGDTRVNFEYNGELLKLGHAIHKDTNKETGVEYDYYLIPNVFSSKDPDVPIRLQYRFSGRPKDMIEAIRAGYGDVIFSDPFGTHRVRRYCDREYGEALRQKTIDGWKDAVFAWGFQMSSIGPVVKNELSDFYPKWKDNYTIVCFKTEEDAQILHQKILEKVQELISSYDFADDNDHERYETCSAAWKEYMNKYVDTIVSRVFIRWVKSNFGEKEYGDIYKGGKCLKIIQTVMQDGIDSFD